MTDEEENTTKEFLRDLANRLMHVPVMYGVDDGDIDRLSRVVSELDKLELTESELIGDYEKSIWNAAIEAAIKQVRKTYTIYDKNKMLGLCEELEELKK